MTLILVLNIFFFRGYLSNKFESRGIRLNLARWDKFVERDLDILLMVQKNEKYSTIAKQLNICEGTLKNRLHFLYSTMEVGDKQGFMSIYGEKQLYFDPDNIVELSKEVHVYPEES